MSKAKLKPCPFCGGEAEPIENYRMHTMCFDCHFSKVHPHKAFHCLSCGGVMIGSLRAWNKRVRIAEPTRRSTEAFSADDYKLGAKP